MPLRAPVERMPLLVQMNVRDEWQKSLRKIQGRINDALGESWPPWQVNTDPNLLYVYADDESHKARIGNVIMSYMEAFCTNLESFVEAYGDEGTRELDMLCRKHIVELAPQEDDTTFAYGGVQIKEGVLRVLFAEGSLGVNVREVSRDIAGALKIASFCDSSATLNINVNARQSIREFYDPKIRHVQWDMEEMVDMPEIRFDPNFEANSAVLAGAGPNVRDDWDKVLGQASLDYFKGLVDQLARAGFGDDGLLQTGFRAEVYKRKILLRVVEKLHKAGRHHEVLVEDGVFVIQTTPENLWVNTFDVGSEIFEIM